MPRYRYQCEKCGEFLEISHSVKEKLTDCEKCGQKNCLKRLLFKIRYVSDNKKTEPKPPGSMVKKFIEETKEELKQEKQSLEKQEYKS